MDDKFQGWRPLAILKHSNIICWYSEYICRLLQSSWLRSQENYSKHGIVLLLRFLPIYNLMGIPIIPRCLPAYGFQRETKGARQAQDANQYNDCGQATHTHFSRWFRSEFQFHTNGGPTRIQWRKFKVLIVLQKHRISIYLDAPPFNEE